MFSHSIMLCRGGLYCFPAFLLLLLLLPSSSADNVDAFDVCVSQILLYLLEINSDPVLWFG